MRDAGVARDSLVLAVERSDGSAGFEPLDAHGHARPWVRAWVVLVALGLVGMLIIAGVPGLADLVPPAAPAASAVPVKAAVSAPPAPAPPASAPAATQTAQLSAAQRQTLCLLGVDPRCLPTAQPKSVSPPTTTATPSSWTQITPPSGSPNPAVRFYPSMTYYPAGHEVLLFGGYGEPNAGPWVFYQDTWAFANGHWTELVDNTSCTPSTCPSPRAGAMMTYDPPAQGVVLYGGYYLTPSITLVALSDTWIFAGGNWHNVTASAGAPPSPRYDGSLVWDSADGYALLFGGAQSYSGTLGDTWTFNGVWTNLTASLTRAPLARAGAAVSNSPSGYILMFGGEYNGSIIEDTPNVNCAPAPQVGWWFYQGAWSPMNETRVCITIASGLASNALADPVLSQAPPCGRLDAALGWSPQNQRFVLYGGIGPFNETGCTGFNGFLNDTWTYQNPPGTEFYWQNATDAGDPPAREQMGYASDFTDNFFEIFGGWSGTDGGLNDTWRFFELVHAKLTGPSSFDTGAQFQLSTPFTVIGFGGTNDLSYSFSLLRLKNANTLQGTGCAILSTGAPTVLPYDGVDQVDCAPTQASYNVYRLTVLVVDNNDGTDRAWANWTFTVVPPEIAVVYSEFTRLFYANFDLTNNFSAELMVANEGALSVSATLGGIPVGFTQRNGQPFWWDSDPVDMGTVTPGSSLVVHAVFTGWDLNATYQVQMIDTPSWLQSFFRFTNATQTIATGGAGPFNKSFAIYENYSWNLSKAFGFNLPVPLISGNYSLIPTLSISVSADSGGNLSLTGGFSLDTPSIDLGVASLKLSASISMTGKFAINTEGPEITGITWLSAKAVVTITGDFSANIPIYGFDILGVHIGFTLNIDVNPSVALNLILAPTTDQPQEIIDGLQVMVSSIFGTFSLPLSVSVSFGIGIASVSLGGKLSLDLTVGLAPTAAVLGGWVNGSVFVSAQALFWSDSWTLLGPATIYSWSDPPATLLRSTTPQVAYNNGSGSTWVLNSRYYTTAGYDAKVWDAAASQGVAISDIYPHTQIAAAAGYDGAYLFYSDDNAELAVTQGLGLSGVKLGASTNQLTALPSPNDSGFVLDRPKAVTLPDGSLYVVWAALPASEASLSSPLDLTSLELHGARFYPGNGTWGPVRRWTTSGIVESYALDGTGSGTLVALTASSFLLGATTPEQLLTFNLTSGAQVHATAAVGLSEILSARGSLDTATVRRLDGNVSLVNLGTAATIAWPAAVPSGSEMLSAAYVPGSASTLLLLIRSRYGAEIALEDTATAQTLATLAVTPDTSEVHALLAGGAYYVFAASHAGITGWKEAGGAFANLSTYEQADIQSFDVVQDGPSIALFSLVTNGNATRPILNLTIAEVGASLPAVVGAPSAPVSPAAGNVSIYVLVLGVLAAVDALLVAILVLRMRRRGRPPAEASHEMPPSEPPARPPASPPGG